MLDGRHTGTGGGNHFVLGGATPADSPFLRRPDLLRSMIGYWLNHPSLSYLFSTSSSGPPARRRAWMRRGRDSLYELEIAFGLIPNPGEGECPPWLVDRIFRHLLVDLTGNTHRSEFCIDKLYSPDSATGRLGLLELRGFEMPPHARMSLTQQLLVRALIAWFWKEPYTQQPIAWGTQLHDRFMLPHFVGRDFGDVLDDLKRAGYPFEAEWFAPHFEFRYPMLGRAHHAGIDLELRQATEPWYVLGEEGAPGRHGALRGFFGRAGAGQGEGLDGDSRYVVTCNGAALPLHSTGTPGGIRGRRQVPGLAAAVVPASDDSGACAVDLRHRRYAGPGVRWAAARIMWRIRAAALSRPSR